VVSTSGFSPAVSLTFNDNLEETIDFRPWLEGPVFEPLKDPSYFRRFFVEGGTVAWPNGADIAPETLYDACVRQQPAKRSRRRRFFRNCGYCDSVVSRSTERM